MRKAFVLGLLVALISIGCVGPSAGDAASPSIDVPELVGGTCSIAEVIAGAFGHKNKVHVVCKVLQGGAGALSNMGTGPTGVEARPPQYATFDFMMTPEQAEAFVKKNSGVK